MPAQTPKPYTTTDIVRQDVSLAPVPLPSWIHSACIVSRGGTDLVAGESVTVSKLYDGQLQLADSFAIATLEAFHLGLNALAGSDTVISSATAISGTATTVVVGDAVTATDVSHGMTVGKVAAIIDGVERIITVTTADVFTYTTDTPPAATISYSTIKLTTAAQTLPVMSVSLGVSGLSPSYLNGLKLATVVNGTTMFIADDAPVGAITAVNAKAHLAVATITSHGLPTSAPFDALISATGTEEYNGVRTIWASDANTVYWGRGLSTLTPSYAIAYLDVVTGTTISNHLLVDSKLMTIQECAPTDYNGTVSMDFISANGFAYIPNKIPYTQATSLGKILSAGAYELNLMLTEYFKKSKYGVTIFEAGTVSVADSVAELAAYIANNPLINHAYILPRGCDGAELAALCTTYNQTQGSLFIVPCEIDNFNLFYNLYSIQIVAESPDVYAINHAAAELGALFVSQIPTPADRLKQQLYKTSNQTPYPFEQPAIALLNEFDVKNVTYISDTAEAAITGSMINGACLTANDGNGGKIDVMSKWAENYLIYQLDTGLARRIFRSANEAGMELSLNDWAGQNCINELRTTAQGIVNAAAAAGVCEPTEVLAEDYWTWKEANPIDYAAKRYTGLSVYANLRIGLREVVFKLIVSFA